MSRRKEALEALLLESVLEHQRLLELRAKDELFYDPDPNWLYMFELETRREDMSMGRTDRSTYSQFFISHALAVKAACNEIRLYLGDRNDHVNALWEAEKWQELFDYSQQHYMARQFKIRMTPIRTSVEKRE